MSVDRLDAVVQSLLEGRIDRYLSMFPKELGEIEAAVKGAVEAFKKDNIIVWFLRFYRLSRLQSVITYSGGEIKKSFENIRNKYVNEYAKKAGTTPEAMLFELDDEAKFLRMFNNSFDHFFSLHIEEIDNYDYGYKLPSQVLEDFRKFELAWAENQRRVLDVEEDLDRGATVILEFEDGWKWFDLGRPSCTREGKAMGHCGNTANPSPKDRVWSLREPVRKGKKVLYKPHCTFIFNDGYFGETKGFANNKPGKDLHKYIVPLLKLKEVEGIRGGGYRPEANFKLGDLPEADFKELFKEKPFLGCYEDLNKYKDPELTDLYLEATLDWFVKGGGEILNGDFVVFEFKSALDLVSRLYEDPHRDQYYFSKDWLEKILDSGSDWAFDMGFDYSPDINDVKHIDHLIPEKVVRALHAYAKREYEDYEEEEVDTVEELFDFFNERDADEVLRPIYNAISDGYRYGQENSIIKTIENELKGDGLSFGEHKDVGSFEFESLWDSPVKFLMSKKDLLMVSADDVDPKEILDKDTNMDYLGDYITLPSIYHRDNYDFDKDAFIDIYHETWDENLPKEFTDSLEEESPEKGK